MSRVVSSAIAVVGLAIGYLVGRPASAGMEGAPGPGGFAAVPVEIAAQAEVDAGRVQKFRPRPGANPAFLISPPVYDAWQ